MPSQKSFARNTLATAALLALLPAAHALSYSWDSGTYVGGTTSPNPLGVGDVLNINAGGNKFLTNTTLDIQGTVNWNADMLYLTSSTINNAGLFNATSNDTLYYYNGDRPLFNNTGTFRKSAGTGETVIGAISFVNTGLIDAQTGTINFNGGYASFLAGTQFTGAGANAVTNNASFSGAFSSANLSLRAGAFNGTGAVVNGTVDFVGGALTGSWQVASGQQMLMKAGANKFITNGTLTNNGTLSWQGGSDLLYMTSSTLDNRGLLDVQGNMTLYYYNGDRPAVINSGTVQVAAGNTLTVGAVEFSNNAGTLNAASGASIVYAGNFATFNAGTLFSGAGSNVVTANARFIDGFTSQNLVLQSGTFYGGDGATAGSKALLGGNVVFTGGSLSQNWEVGAGSQLTMKDGGSKLITNANVVNKGTMSWQASTDPFLYMTSSSLTNQALFEAQESFTLYYYNGDRSTVTNTATGTMRALAGKTLTVGAVEFANNGGTLDAAAGGTINYAGNFATFNAGTRFTGAGTNLVTANARFIDGFNSQNLVLQSGTFYGGDGVTAGSKALLGGNVAFTGGTLAQNWEIGAGQQLALKDGGSKLISNANVVNKGTMSWQGTADANIYMTSSTLTNQALFEAQESVTLYYYNGDRSTVTNTATGTMRALAGKTLTVGGVDFFNNGGTLDAVAGGTINYAGNFATFNAGTRFTGAGTNLVTANARFIDDFNSQNLVLQSGTFYGGDGVTPGSKAVVGGSVTFTGGTLAQNWEVAAGQQVTAVGGGSKFMNNGSLVNKGAVAWTTTDTLFMTSSTINNQGRFDLQADAQLLYYTGDQPSFINNGLLIKSAGAGTADLSTIVLTNNGVINVQSGAIRVPNNFANAGTIKGVGAVTTNALTNNGHMAPGETVGTLSVNGNFIQSAGGSLDIEVTSLASSDLLQVFGSATLDGTLAVSCFGNCSYAVGDQILVLDYSGARSGSFAGLSLSGFATGNFIAVYDDINTRVLLQVTEAVTPIPVPEPESWAMMLGGMAFLAWLARRRQPQARRL